MEQLSSIVEKVFSGSFVAVTVGTFIRVAPGRETDAPCVAQLWTVPRTIVGQKEICWQRINITEVMWAFICILRVITSGHWRRILRIILSRAAIAVCL